MRSSSNHHAPCGCWPDAGIMGIFEAASWVKGRRRRQQDNGLRAQNGGSRNKMFLQSYEVTRALATLASQFHQAIVA